MRLSARSDWLFAAATAAILLLGAWLRLWRLDLAEFRTDEAWALRLAEDMVRLGRLPEVGLTTSLGVQNPPAFVYFLAPFVAFNRDPLIASAAVGVVNVAGIAGLILLARRILSPLGGLVAGLAYAVSPWAVFYARKIWAQDIVGAWAILLFVALDQGVIASRVGWAVAALPLFAIGVQIHFSFALLAPLLIAPLGVLITHRRFWHLALGVGLALLTVAPYLVYSQQTNWADLRELQSRLTGSATVDGKGPAYLLQLTTGLGNGFVVAVPHSHVMPESVVAIAANLDTVLLGLGSLVALVLTFAPGAAMRDRRLRLGGMLLWLLLPALLTIRHSVPLYEHYYLLGPPVAALLIGVGIHSLAGWRMRWSRLPFVVAVCALLTVASIHTLIVTRLLDYLAVDFEQGYGEPLGVSEAVARDIVDFGAHADSQHLVVELPGPDREPIAYLARPFFPKLETLLDGVNVAQVGFGSGLAPMSASPEVASARPFLGPLVRLDLRYADSLEVLNASSFSHAAPGQRVGLAMTWTVGDPVRVTRDGLVWEMSLYDPSGREVAREPGAPHDLSGVSPDDAIVSWLTLGTDTGAAPGQYQLAVRRLDQRTRQPLEFVDTVGQPNFEWRSPPIDVQFLTRG